MHFPVPARSPPHTPCARVRVHVCACVCALCVGVCAQNKGYVRAQCEDSPLRARKSSNQKMNGPAP